MLKNNKLLCLSLIVVSLFMLSCKRENVLEGYVVDGYQQRPLPGKIVWVEDEQYVTDHNGSFKASFSLDSVKIHIEADDRFHAFTDQVALYQRHNIRKFLVDARHPLNFANNIYEPFSFIAHISTPPEDDRNISIRIEGIPYDQSYTYQGSFADQEGQLIHQDMVQIDFNFWYRDHYNNWQYSSLPPEHLPLWGMVIDQYMEAMYHYYHDLAFEYEILPNTETIENEEVTIIRVFPAETSDLFDEMLLYTISQGPQQGMIKKAIIHSEHHSWLSPQIIIAFEAVNLDIMITPPAITY